ncbi:MFS transporter [Rhizobium lusitanum]|nr:MFS transporter [Rhizobium lusitanum]
MLGVSIGALLPNAMEAFSLSPLMAGMVFVVWSIGFSLGSIIAERLLRAYGTIAVLAVLSSITALCAFFQFSVMHAAVFFAIYLALGLCGGAIFTASHTLFGDLFAERRSSALAILDVVFSVGNMAAPLVIVAILRWQWSWQSFYLIAALGFSAISCLFVLQLFGNRLSAKHKSSSRALEKKTGLEALPLLSIACLAIASFALGAVEWTQNVWFVTYALAGGASEELARFSLSSFTAGMIASRLAVIWFDVAGRSVFVLRFMLALALLGELSVVFGGADVPMLTGNFLLGAGIGGLFPIFLGRAMDRHPASSAALSMLMVVSLTLGGQVASFTLGALAEQFGVSAAFLVTLPVIAIMAMAFEASSTTSR